MDLDTAKIICLVSLWVSTWFFTCVPYFLIASGQSSPKHVRIRDMAISYLKCFAGGVFMSACFLNLLPSGMRSMDKYFEMIGADTDFPAFMCIVALGFFIIAVVELLAHSMIHKSTGHAHTHNSVEQTHTHQNGHVNSTGPGIGVLSHCTIRDNGTINAAYNGREQPTQGQDSIEMTDFCTKRGQTANDLTLVPNGGRHAVGNGHTKAESAGGHDEVKDMLTALEANPLRAFLLLAALSFHTVFDGLAVGLEPTESEVWQMFTAIIIHKSLVAVCLGLQLFLQYKDRPLHGVLWSLFFSIIAPIGIGIGMALTSGDIDETAKQLTNTFLQGLAAGTFVFVTFFEILKEEIVDKKGFKRLFLVALGFASMGLIKYYA